ncbi:high-affinity Fe2+/Pb2+ permease [Methylobacterium sp. RAS18]|nr:high-affinity Fe2+/Pb2+ permease [Methylobacterium sp. RAS18]
MLAGAALAVLALVLIAWLMFRASIRLPIGQFFGTVSILLAVLAVVLMGKAVTAFQEAGYLPVLPLPGFPRIEMFDIYPTREGVVAQVILLSILTVGFAYSRWSDKHISAAPRS